MSELLDGLARSLAEPMPRRRALRVLAVTLAGAMLSGRGVMTAAATSSSASGCPDPGDLFCGGCENVNGLNYGDVCCPGPDASKYWECDCKKGPGGYNGCKRKTGCDISCGSGCCDSATEKCCPSGNCVGQEFQCCGPGGCPAGTHCCYFFSAYEESPKDAAHAMAGVSCCPDGWACCNNTCCMPGTYCVAQSGEENANGDYGSSAVAKNGAQGYGCSHGSKLPFAKKGTKPIPWAKTIPGPPSQ
jgi:hypothetical protein